MSLACWRVKCQEEGHVYVWAETEPTACPNNGAHTFQHAHAIREAIMEVTESTDPGATDDITKGYDKGTKWINDSTGNWFRCTDNTEGAAAWTQMSGWAGHTVQDEGSSLALRSKLNFIGAGVTATDNPGADATDVTISGGGGGGHTVQDEGTPLTARANLNFIGANVTVTDNAGADATDVTISGNALTAMPVARASKNATQSGSAGYVAVTWEDTDLESDVARLDHDAANNSRIVAKEAGQMLIMADMDLIVIANSVVQFEVRKNGVALPNTDTQMQYVDADECLVPVTATVDCAANDYVEIWWNAVAGHTIQHRSRVSAVLLKGVKGDTGPTGPSGDIVWVGAWVTSTAYLINDTVENNGSSYVCTANHTSSAGDEPGVGGSWATYWDLVVSKGDTGAAGPVNSIDVAINQGSTAYWATSNGTYETAASILFRGTATVGTPTNIKACNWQDSGVTGALRIYDTANSQVIAEVTGLTNTTKTIVDFGAISNLPAGEACFEVQIKRTAGGGSTKTIISNCSIQF